MNYFLRRLITVIVTILLVSLITFLVFEIIPGDPVLSKLGLDADQAQINALQSELGLDQPVYIRYKNMMANALRGDLGMSIRFDQPVVSLIKDRILVTAALTLLSLALIVCIGIPLGILVARYDNIGGWLISSITQVGMAIPSFWLGIIITFVFGLVLKLFVPGGFVPLSENLGQSLMYLFFAAIAIAIPQIAVVVRYMRNAILEQKRLDYVRTASSKGCKESRLLFGHMLKNALVPVITILGMIIADVLGGSLIVEQVFNIPGIGRLLIMAITNRDFPLISGVVLYISVIVVLINFLVDIAYHLVDPRIGLK